MSGIGPLGFSFSSSFMQSYLMRTHKDAKGPRKVKGGNRGIMMVGYALLRIILGVDSGLVGSIAQAKDVDACCDTRWAHFLPTYRSSSSSAASC